MSADFRFRRTWGPAPRYPRVRAWDGECPSFTVIAGPCSIESPDQVRECAVAAAGIRDKLPARTDFYMRGGVFRAGTYPPEKFGLQYGLLRFWKDIAIEYGLKIVVEVLDIRELSLIEPLADALQVGARQSQGYTLLTEVARVNKPVFLKNGPGMKLDEILGALEYLAQGICQPRLIIRGSSSFHDHVRWDLSISLIPAVKAITKIPVLVDPSHGTGRRDLVWPMAVAGVSAGADGLLVEMHPTPEKSLSDADQAVSQEVGRLIVEDAVELAEWFKCRRQEQAFS